MRDVCPRCGSRQHKKNGHIHNGKQNHRCKACGRQFVREFAQRLSLGRVPGVGRKTSQGTALPARHLPCGRREHDVADGLSESSAMRRRPRTLTYSPRGTATWRLRRTNSAALSAKRPISSGCGWPWTPGAIRCLLSMSGIAAATARGSYGTSSRQSIANTRRFTRMLMQPTAASFPGHGIGGSPRPLGRPITWSGSMGLYGSGSRAWCPRRYRFPNPWPITPEPSVTSSAAITGLGRHAAGSQAITR
jgi:transposase-like protein